MADGVAVVEQDADVEGFALVLADDVGLDGHAAADDLGGNFGFHFHEGFGVFFEYVDQGRVEDEAVLDGFGPTLGEFSLAESGKGLDVGEDGAGLVERSDHVLGLGQVHGDLAADGGVDHGGHAGGNLDKGHAAQEGAGDESAEVAGDAAADSDDGMAALGLEAHQPLVDFLGLLE